MSPRQHNDVIMSSPEQKEEKEVGIASLRFAYNLSHRSLRSQFWSSPPAKTPRNERHQLLTPVKSGAKQPDDWWLKSPFKTDRGKKFHEKVDFKSPGFGRLTSQFSDFQMMEAGGSAAALSASNSAKHKPTGPSLTGRKSNILFGDFIPAPSSPRGSRPTTPTNELNTLLMFPEASMNSIPLPFELLSLILAYLGPADLMQCVVVSKAWCNATTPNLWKEVRVRSTVGWSKIFGVLKGKPPQAIAGGLGEDFNPLADSPRRSGRAASPGKLSSTSKGIIPFQNHLRHGPRAPVYRSLIKGWAYSSIDADGKRLPMTRGATVQILQSLLTTRAYMPNLRRVSVAGGAEWVDDKFLGMLAAGFGGVLESLTLSGCRNISREALISSMPEFKALSSLRIEYSQAVDREVISRIVAARGSSLESIAIVYCGSLDDEAVKLLSKCREVEITFCPQVTVSGGIRSLVAEAKHLELLRAGHVSWGEPSKPTTLKMPSSLQLVDFSGLPILDDSTEKAPSKLSVTLPTKLKRLLLRDLPRPVRLARVQALIHRCSLLEVLDLSGTSIADITQGELSRALGRSGLQIVSDHEEH